MKKVTHFKQYISTWKMQKANYSKVACTTQKNVAYCGGEKSICIGMMVQGKEKLLYFKTVTSLFWSTG